MELRIRELRTQNKLTVQQLADKIGISKSYMSELETGKKIPNQHRLAALAKALDCHVVELLSPESVTDEERELISSFFRIESAADRANIISLTKSLGN